MFVIRHMPISVECRNNIEKSGKQIDFWKHETQTLLPYPIDSPRRQHRKRFVIATRRITTSISTHVCQRQFWETSEQMRGARDTSLWRSEHPKHDSPNIWVMPTRSLRACRSHHHMHVELVEWTITGISGIPLQFKGRIRTAQCFKFQEWRWHIPQFLPGSPGYRVD